MKKTVIYSRVSTVIQDYASQTKDLQKEAERQGYEVFISTKKKNQAL